MTFLNRFLNLFRGTPPQQLVAAPVLRIVRHDDFDEVEAQYQISRSTPAVDPRGSDKITYVERDKRGYQAAAYSRSDPWSASGGDAWRELRESRPALVNRALALSRDSGLFRRALSVKTDYTCGPAGFALKNEARNLDGSPDALAQGIIERRFRQWANGPVTLDRRMDLAALLRTAYQSMQVCGEVFIHKAVTPDGLLQLRLIESPCVPDQLDRDLQGEPTYTRAGIVFDRTTHAVAGYEVLTKHPGALHSFFGGWLGSTTTSVGDCETVRLDAKDVIHCGRFTRVGAIRGEPLGVGCMPDLEMFRKYESAELAAARANAARPVVIEKSLEAGQWAGDQTGSDGRIELDLSENGASMLPAGYKMSFSPVTHPPGNYSPFVSTIIKKICADLGVSPWMVVESLEAANYVTLRASHTHFMQHVAAEQKQLMWQLLTPIYLAFIEYELLSQRLKPLSWAKREKYAEHSWIAPRVKSLDESRDISALQQAIALNLMSADEACRAFSGRELDDVIAERVAERKKLAAAGLPDAADVLLAKTTPGQNSPEDELPDEGMQQGAKQS